MLNQTIKLQEKRTPIDTAKAPFTGRFIGNGFAVTGFIVEPEEGETGFFGGCEGAQLQNLLLEEVQAQAPASFSLVLAPSTPKSSIALSTGKSGRISRGRERKTALPGNKKHGADHGN